MEPISKQNLKELRKQRNELEKQIASIRQTLTPINEAISLKEKAILDKKIAKAKKDGFILIKSSRIIDMGIKSWPNYYYCDIWECLSDCLFFYGKFEDPNTVRWRYPEDHDLKVPPEKIIDEFGNKYVFRGVYQRDVSRYYDDAYTTELNPKYEKIKK